jgi:hypothetical protein
MFDGRNNACCFVECGNNDRDLQRDYPQTAFLEACLSNIMQLQPPQFSRLFWKLGSDLLSRHRLADGTIDHALDRGF